jgi:hypothetical protein
MARNVVIVVRAVIGGYMAHEENGDNTLYPGSSSEEAIGNLISTQLRDGHCLCVIDIDGPEVNDDEVSDDDTV